MKKSLAAVAVAALVITGISIGTAAPAQAAPQPGARCNPRVDRPIARPHDMLLVCRHVPGSNNVSRWKLVRSHH